MSKVKTMLKDEVLNVDFASKEEMQDFLKDMVAEDIIEEPDLGSLSLAYVKPGSTPIYKGIDADKEVVDKLFANGGYLLMTDKGIFVCSSYVFELIKKRAGDTGLIFKTMDNIASKNPDKKEAIEQDKCKHLNMSWQYLKGETGKALIRGDRLLALHSSRYSVIPQDVIFNELSEFIEGAYPHNNFEAGSYSHEYTEAVWGLANYKDAVFEKYRNAWIDAGRDEEDLEDMTPSFVFRTSDTGMYCVTVYPTLSSKSRRLILGLPLAVKHTGLNDIDKVKGLFPEAFSRLEKGINATAELISTPLSYPVPAAVRAAKEAGLVKLAKKATKEVLENFQVTVSAGIGRTFTAYDVYNVLCNVAYSAKVSAMKGVDTFQLEEQLSRLLKLDWESMDRVGPDSL